MTSTLGSYVTNNPSVSQPHTFLEFLAELTLYNSIKFLKFN